MRRPLHAALLRVFGVLPRRARSRVIRILYPTFTAGTGVALIDRAGRVLLVSQPYSDGWSLPGGLMGRSEEPAETAAREVSEEVGLDIELGGALPVAVRTPDRRHFNFIFRIDLETAGGETPAPQSPEISGVGWFSPDHLPELAEHVDLLLAAVGLLPPYSPSQLPPSPM